MGVVCCCMGVVIVVMWSMIVVVVWSVSVVVVWSVKVVVVAMAIRVNMTDHKVWTFSGPVDHPSVGLLNKDIFRIVSRTKN